MTVESEVARARALIGASQFHPALTVLRSVFSADPENATAWCLTAQCELALGDDTKARDAAVKAVAANPQSEWGHRLLSISLMRIGAFAPAREEADVAISLAPDEWRTYRQRAAVDAAAKDVDWRSWDAARRAVELAPNDAESHLVLGNVALVAKDNDVALAAFREALRVDPNNAVARNNLAVVQLRRRRLGAAAANLMGALRLDPQSKLFATNLRVVLRVWAFLLAALEVIGGPLALGAVSAHHFTTTVVHNPDGSIFDPSIAATAPYGLYATQTDVDGPTPHGHVGALIAIAAVLAGLFVVVLVVMYRAIGARTRAVVMASFHADKILGLIWLCVTGSMAALVASAVIGVPTGRSLLSVGIGLSWVGFVGALVAGRVARSRNRKLNFR